MTEIFIRHIAAPKAQMVLGIILGEKREEKIREKQEKEDSGVRLTGLWISDIPSPLVSLPASSRNNTCVLT